MTDEGLKRELLPCPRSILCRLGNRIDTPLRVYSSFNNFLVFQLQRRSLGWIPGVGCVLGGARSGHDVITNGRRPATRAGSGPVFELNTTFAKKLFRNYFIPRNVFQIM